MKRILICLTVFLIGCVDRPVQSVSGVKMASSPVQTDDSGHTPEQINILDKIQSDARPDMVWHAYFISPHTGKVFLYQEIRGKVTSSGKRLTPETVQTGLNGQSFKIGETTYYTEELIGEDGTFGKSTNYLFWKDEKGIRHRHYDLGSHVLHMTDKPIDIE